MFADDGLPLPSAPAPAAEPEPDADMLGPIPAALLQGAQKSGLTDQQCVAAIAIATGQSVARAATISKIGLSQLRWMKSSNLAFRSFLDQLVLKLETSVRAEGLMELRRQLEDAVDKRVGSKDIFEWVRLSLSAPNQLLATLGSPGGGRPGFAQQAARSGLLQAGVNLDVIPTELGGDGNPSPNTISTQQLQGALDVSGKILQRCTPEQRRQLADLLRVLEPAGEGVGPVQP